jgi:crotonobetainyl-CoA:carnitine CoA-transferase CaiB-like acyl-CoA transferase
MSEPIIGARTIEQLDASLDSLKVTIPNGPLAELATVEKREENCRELVRILDGLFAEHDFAEWEKRAAEQDFISTRVNELTDLADDPQIQANGYFERRPHPVLGNGPRSPRRSTSRGLRSASAAAPRSQVRTTTSCCPSGWAFSPRTSRSSMQAK